jgi:O-antigen/teichoic acid export membrane protein
MRPVPLTTSTRPQSLSPMRTIFSDALYRGTFYLLANTIATSAIGFVFWTLAAHRYSASTVGTFSGVTSGANLLAAIAALGLPITMTRHIASAENPRELVLFAVTIIATVGTILCLATVLILGSRLPADLHVGQRGGMALLVTALVVFTATGSTLDAGLIATRSSPILLIKNLAGSIVKLVAMLLLAATFRSSGLLISFGLGLVLATVLSGVALGRHIRSVSTGHRRFNVPWHYLSETSANYVATVIGILPISIVPIEVLAVRGTTQTAHFSVALLIAGILNFIPSTMGQVLFAEVARGGVPLGIQFRKALRVVYGLLLPSLAILIIFAPFILRLFGQAYEMAATGCLRVLALSALAAGGTYVVDSLLIARDRTSAYIFMQVANASLMLGCVGILLPHGITAAACGWTLAQGLTLVIGLLVLAIGRLGRHHHSKVGTAPAGEAPGHQRRTRQSQPVIHTFEPQIQELLTIWPMMPTTLIAEQIGWDHSIQILHDRVTEMRSAYSHPNQNVSWSSYPAGEVAQCSLWFPPIEIPVGLGQMRSARQLPVLTMITGYSRWMSAILIPSVRAEDLFAGWWKLITELGAVPHTLTSHSADAIGWWMNGRTEITAECRRFCRSLSTALVIGRAGDPATTGLIERAQALLEHSFLYDRTFNSPEDFKAQLRDWLTVDNARRRQPPDRSPTALIAADRMAMLPLPPIPPATGWRQRLRVGDRPFVRFDSNEYSVHPALIGCTIELVADLSQIRILSNGKVRAVHDRAWTRGQTIRHPVHGAAPR